MIIFTKAEAIKITPILNNLSRLFSILISNGLSLPRIYGRKKIHPQKNNMLQNHSTGFCMPAFIK